MNNSILYNKLSHLTYSRCNTLTDNVYSSTLSSLDVLFKEYGYSQVLGELSQIWPLQKAIPFFERLNPTCQDTDINTIAFISRRANNGGIERVQAQLISLCVSMNYHVILLTDSNPTEWDYPYPNEVERIIISTPCDMVRRLQKISDILISNNVNIVVNNFWLNGTVLWECMLTRLLGKAYIQHTHGCFAVQFESGQRDLFNPMAYRLCNLVLSLSEPNARFYQLLGCRSYLIQNPIPEDLFRIKEIAPLSSRHILMLGRLSKEKHPMKALQIFSKVHKQFPDATLDIVGMDDGDYHSQIDQYCVENSLTNSVIIHGSKNQDEINSFLHNSCCLIFTSEMEGYPMVLMEAKAHGLPIVMYDLSFLTMAKDSKGMLTAPFGDISTCASHIIRLLNDDSFRKNIGKEARESFESFARYDIKSVWKEIFELSTQTNIHISDTSEFISPQVNDQTTTLTTPSVQASYGNYYAPNDVLPDERLILPWMLNGINRGYCSDKKEINEKNTFRERIKRVVAKLLVDKSYTNY